LSGEDVDETLDVEVGMMVVVESLRGRPVLLTVTKTVVGEAARQDGVIGVVVVVVAGAPLSTHPAGSRAGETANLPLCA